jgi:aldose 1-epimerase
VTDHGATLVSLKVADRIGQAADVLLGFDDVSGYESDKNQYFGCTTGRVCNRIAKGRFTLDGYDYQLAINNAPNHLHGGGPRSLDKVRWRGVATQVDGAPAVEFTYRSPDGEEGYPGTLDARVTYSLRQDDAFQIDYAATALDKDTHVNLTNHAYFNLNPAAATVYEHLVQVNAARYAPAQTPCAGLCRSR